MENNKLKSWEKHPELYPGNIHLLIKDKSSKSPLDDVAVTSKFYNAKKCAIVGPYKIISKDILK